MVHHRAILEPLEAECLQLAVRRGFEVNQRLDDEALVRESDNSLFPSFLVVILRRIKLDPDARRSSCEKCCSSQLLARHEKGFSTCDVQHVGAAAEPLLEQRHLLVASPSANVILPG